MKALTIHQPWAGLIMAGLKTVENRTWRPHHLKPGERFAIHAGRDTDVADWVVEEMQKRLTTATAVYCAENGVILGTVVYRGYVTKADDLPAADRKWFVGPIAWLLEDPHEWNLPPKIKGALGLWEVPEDCGKLS